MQATIANVRNILKEIEEQEEDDDLPEEETLREWIETLAKAFVELATKLEERPARERQTSLLDQPAREEESVTHIFRKGMNR